VNPETLQGARLCYLSLGSNVGDRAAFLNRAIERLGHEPKLRIVRASRVYENPALIFPDQPDFLNQILEIETLLEPLELLTLMKRIEDRIGRVRRFRYGPREIDLDILSYQGVRMETRELALPHPGLEHREYLSVLLSDLGETPLSISGKSQYAGKTA
jgi:2-amino-4-hydroxy-6-hydroxymethyldihydropteridine diphosphokinase